MESQTIAIVVAALVALVFLVLWLKVRAENEKMLLQYKPLKKERDDLHERVEKLRQKNAALTSEKKSAKEQTKADKKSAKEDKKKDEAPKEDPSREAERKAFAEQAEKLHEVKEENYRLKQDNKELRKSLRERDQIDNDTQKQLVDAREALDNLKAEFEAVDARARKMEAELAAKAEEIVVSKEEKPAEPVRNTEAEDKLRQDVDRLAERLKDVKDELATYKKNYKAEVDAAKQQVYEAAKDTRRQLITAKRQIGQLKKRVENSQKIFLIARSQLMLAEQRLSELDAEYKPSMPLPTSPAGIEETLNKAIARNARDEKLLADAEKNALRVAQLEATIRELKNGQLKPEDVAPTTEASLSAEAIAGDFDSDWDLDIQAIS